MEQIRQIYDEYFPGKVMTVISDCNYSGCWVTSCMNCLEKRNIQPCQHSSRKNKTYLSFISSCGEYETAITPLMVVRAFSNNKEGNILMRLHKSKLATSQHLQYCITTIKTCDADFDEQCSLPTNYSWSTKRLDERVHFIRSRIFDRWVVVSISGPDDITDRLRRSNLEDLMDFEQYAIVLDTGMGREPPIEKLMKLYKMFPMNNIRFDL